MNIFEPVVRYQPGEFRSALAVGLAMTRASRIDAGIDRLRRVVQAHPGRVEAWDCLLTGLDESGQVDILKDELERLPATLSTLPQLAKHRARVAQGRNQWTEAADLYRQARAAEPDNRVVEYRLGGALRHTGRSAEADRIDRACGAGTLPARTYAHSTTRPSQYPTWGFVPTRSFIRGSRPARDAWSLPEEAGAWHRIVLGNDPKNEVSRAALTRLSGRMKDESNAF